MMLLACALLALVAGLTAGPLAAAERPNFVVIFADDLGINDLACYGRKDHSTPRLDRMAQEGLRFTCAYCAQPICSPSRAGLLTGRSPAHFRLTTYLPGRADAATQRLLHPVINQHLPLEAVTVAEALRAAGYATGCFGKWHLGGQGFGPKEQGFDVYFPGTANTKPSDTEGGKGEYELTRRAIEFIETNRDRPFFCYLPHNTPHIPLAAKPELIEKNKDAFNPTYAAMMESLDECVGQVLDKLAELGLDEKTIVVFASDNGGLHVLEGTLTPATHNTPFRAGKGFLYEGGLRIPLIVRWPKTIQPAVVDEPVSLMDLSHTFVEAAAAKPLPAGEGRSLLAGLRGEKSFAALAEGRTFFWHFPHYTNQGSRPGGAIRRGKLKVIVDFESDRAELYDLSQDPSEERNLSEAQPQAATALQTELRALVSASGFQTNRPNPAFLAPLAKPLYEDVDVSRLKPEATAATMAERLKPWREAMNAALRPRAKPQPKSPASP